MSEIVCFTSAYKNLWDTYSKIAMFMDRHNYDEQVVIDALKIVNKLHNYSLEQQKELLTLFFKILKTTAGTIFLRANKNFARVAVNKAEEFMNIASLSDDDDDIELCKAISTFFAHNDGVFCDHGFHEICYSEYESYLKEHDDDD
jgi:hypothetical protein